MTNTKLPIDGACGDALRKHYPEIADLHLRDMFRNDPSRCETFSLECCDLFLDYSKNRILPQTLQLLIDLAEQSDIPGWRERLLSGDIVNTSEARNATHVAFRMAVDAANSEYRETLTRMRRLSETLYKGQWLGASGQVIRDVVCLGIGGSHLGSAMACHAVDASQSAVTVHFVATAGARELQDCLKDLSPAQTLFVVSTKSFANWETIDNAHQALQWLEGAGLSPARHCIAISGNPQAADILNIDPENCLDIPDSIGGRYSLCSAAGLPFAIHAGMDAFEELLRGAQSMDIHFRDADSPHNMPVILSLLDVWYHNFFAVQSHAVLSYVERLEYFPRYLQQLEMESNGKRVTHDGEPVAHQTASVLWGGLALGAQHSVSQLLHQGTPLIPVDFIISCQQGGDDDRLWANFLTQSHLLMHGNDDSDSHRYYPGNRPSTSLLVQQLTPRALGSLVALYEHKVFCNSVIWGINPFDQWGVVEGKTLSNTLYDSLQNDRTLDTLDSSSHRLAQRYLKGRK